MWDDVVIGSGDKGCSAIKVFGIGDENNVSQNSVSYWVSNCYLGMGMTIFKNTEEGRKLAQMIEEKRGSGGNPVVAARSPAEQRDTGEAQERGHEGAGRRLRKWAREQGSGSARSAGRLGRESRAAPRPVSGLVGCTGRAELQRVAGTP